MINEEIILGQILIDHKVWYSMKLKAVCFNDARCRRGFTIMHTLFDQGQQPDLLSVVEADKTISPAWWAELSNISSSANWEFYHDKIIESYRMRELSTLKSYISDWIDDNLESGDILERIDKRLLEISVLADKDRIYKVSELLGDFVETLEKRYATQGALPGLSTGIPMLDEATLGLQPRLKYQIGGRPSDGKSALMITLVCNMAVAQQIQVGVISLESSKEELLSRIVANIGSIDSRDIQTGLLKAVDFARIMDANGKIYDAPLWIYDIPNLSLSELKAQARRMVRQHKVKVLFIDYEQLVEIPGVHKKLDRATEVSIAIKNLARELEIPIVSLAQLRRDADNRRPTLADFSDTSQIEKDADGAILIYHDKEKGISRLCVEKMRDGQTGDIQIYFDKPHVKFTEAVQGSNYDNQ